MKWQVPEKCFPTNHEGSRNEESKHNQWVPGSGWLPPHRADQVGPSALLSWYEISWCSAHREVFLLGLHS